MPLSTTGLAYVCLAWAGFGSFGVPIKAPAVLRAKVHPLAFQTYKSAWVFATCFLALLSVDFAFTWWGVVSAAFWVPAGIMAVLAITDAGLCLAIATMNSTGVVVGFVWGAVVFAEPLRSPLHAVYGLLLMLVGICGMSYYSTGGGTGGGGGGGRDSGHSEALLGDGAAAPAADELVPVLPGLRWTRRRRGVAAAIFNGAWGASYLAPLKMTGGNGLSGAQFLLSFGVGVAVVTAALWAAVWAAARCGAVAAVPSLQPRVMAVPGSIAGIAWAAGNAGSIAAVETLGEAVGYPATQCGGMLVAGLWGVFYHKEVPAKDAARWLLFACVGASGIALLCAQTV